MGEAVRERPVVRQQERAGRIRVEPPDRDDALRDVDEVDHRRTPCGVARRRDRPHRLVQQDVGELLRADELPVDLDAILPLDEGVQLSRLAVDGDAAGLDQLVGAAA